MEGTGVDEKIMSKQIFKIHREKAYRTPGAAVSIAASCEHCDGPSDSTNDVEFTE